MKERKYNIKFLNDCLLIKDVLIVSDLHIGYDEQIYGDSIFPKIIINNILEKLDNILYDLDNLNIKIKKFILLGDIKDNFGNINKTEWREILLLIDYIKNKMNNPKIIVIKGNHDKILSPILKKRNILMRNYYKFKLNKKIYYFFHGDKIFKNCLNSDYLIFGHIHPAITLKNKYKHEKFKCFLVGNINKKKFIVLPSFSDIRYGYNLNNLKNLNYNFSFINIKMLNESNVIIYNDDEKKEYNFGKLKYFI